MSLKWSNIYLYILYNLYLYNLYLYDLYIAIHNMYAIEVNEYNISDWKSRFVLPSCVFNNNCVFTLSICVINNKSVLAPRLFFKGDLRTFTIRCL